MYLNNIIRSPELAACSVITNGVLLFLLSPIFNRYYIGPFKINTKSEILKLFTGLSLTASKSLLIGIYGKKIFLYYSLIYFIWRIKYPLSLNYFGDITRLGIKDLFLYNLSSFILPNNLLPINNITTINNNE